MPSTYAHPKPTLNRLTQVAAAVLLVVMLVASLAQLVIGLTERRAPLLVLSGMVTLLLTLPVLMLTTLTPALTPTSDGVTITPVVWKPIRVAWREIAAIKDDPMLPPHEVESGRKLLRGKQNYRAAEGKILLIPSLPIQYRVNGFFAGEGLTPLIAFTNRSHVDYARLLAEIEAHMQEARA